MLAGAPDCTGAAFCSCAIRSPEISYARAEAVFSGVVTHVGEIGAERGQPVTLRITRTWKGSFSESIVVRDAHPCGVVFQAGAEYLVYALRDQDGRIYTTFCARSRPLVNAAEDLRVLDRMPAADR
ncbi:MAG TPA: hypothetical protein VEQ60_13090 [Longimicrobium sp.]|nr:hypothetical protein [Longimicrobium sp.]